jgi:hypothetical protein
VGLLNCRIMPDVAAETPPVDGYHMTVVCGEGAIAGDAKARLTALSPAGVPCTGAAWSRCSVMAW